ncbi:MAG: TIGR02530 family flagellar biosynthesis protein [Eubacteriales bacterium]
MKIQKQNFPSIEQVYGNNNKNKPNIKPKGVKTSFEDILQNQINTKEDIKFSKHANERLESRNINLSKNQIERLENGVMKAKEKGVKESLILMDNIAFVINVPNQTVITAVEQQNSQNQVFTNIDGAVIL